MKTARNWVISPVEQKFFPDVPPTPEASQVEASPVPSPAPASEPGDAVYDYIEDLEPGNDVNDLIR